MAIVQLPYSQWQDPVKSGRSIVFGNIYVGQPDTDPTVPANQLQVFYIDENEQQINLSQPLRTNGNGFVVISSKNSTVVQPRVQETNYSVTVQNKQEVTVWSVPNAAELSPVIDVQHNETLNRNATGAHDGAYSRNFNNITDLKSQTTSDGTVIDLSQIVGARVIWRGHRTVLDGGGNSGIVRTGTHTGNDFSIISISPTVYIEADISGDKISILKAGGLADGVFDNSPIVSTMLSVLDGSVQIYFPGNSNAYRFNSPISIDTTGQGNQSINRFVGDGLYRTTLDNRSENNALLKVTSGSAAEFAYGFRVDDLAITASGSEAGTMGIDLTGCRFVELNNVRIEGMSSHGIFGLSTVGDFTDNSGMRFTQLQIENNGGYGIYAASQPNAIQYGWNLKQCRIGNNALGGVLLETMINCEIFNCGIYNNSVFGMRITKRSGADNPSVININQCEFDTNQGVQLDIEFGLGINVDQPYLIANVPSGEIAFTQGIVIGDTSTTVISSAYPRLNPSLTGLTVIEIESAAVDTKIQNTIYDGYSSSNGDMYDNNSTSTIIDDRTNRIITAEGTFTSTLQNSTGTVTSPTSVTGYYYRVGSSVTAAFRNLNNINTFFFDPNDILTVSLPIACVSNTNASFTGSCIITSDTGTGAPVPVVSNGGDEAAFKRQGSNAFLTASELSNGISDISEFTITYIID